MDRQSQQSIPAKTSPGDGSDHLAYIDALRGWAFLAVMTVHIPQLVKAPAIVLQMLPACNYGVQLFYVVSALTLFMSFEARRTRERRPIRAFFLRRFFRIAPLFWLAALVYTWHDGMGPRDSAPDGISWLHVLATILFAHGWHPTSINSVVPGGWSIAVEFNFYLILPFCFYWFAGLRRSITLSAIIFVVSVLVSVMTKRWLMAAAPAEELPLITNFTYYWLPRQFPVFTLGFVLFAALKTFTPVLRSTPSPTIRHLLNWLPYVTLVLVAGLYLTSTRIPLGYFVTSCAFALLAFALAFRPIRLLVNPVSCYVGKISFSAYICHFLVISVIGQLLVPSETSWGTSSVGFLLCYLIVGLCTAAVSTVTYHLIEVPGQSLGRSVINRLGYGRIRQPVPA